MGKGPITVGLAGFGTVGSGLTKILEENEEWIKRRTGREIRIKTILVRDLSKRRDYLPPEGATFTDNPKDLVEDEQIDVVVELIGGMETACDLITMALKAGKHVVTANKQLLAERGQELFSLASKKNLCLYYEASSVGGVPVVQTLKESLAGNRIKKLTGIMNGTANYILSEMTTNGLDFSAALGQATELGYAEADPSFDIDGIDTAHKLVLLVRLAYGVHYPFDRLAIDGIRNVKLRDIEFAREFGYRIKLIGQVRDVGGKLEAGVFPALVQYTYLMARVGGNYNAVRIEGNACGPIMLHGQGAGDLPTGSAVLADIMAVIKDKDAPNNTGFADPNLPEASILQPDLAASQHYFRFTVADRPGVMASVSRVMAEQNISIAQVLQKGQDPGGNVPMVVISHEASARDVNAAIAEIDAMSFIGAPTVHYRIL